MAEGTSGISDRVLDALTGAGLITQEQLASAKDTAMSSGVAAGDAIVSRGLVTLSDLEHVLEEELGIPKVDLSSYAPDDEALRMLPAERARELVMLPLFEIEGMLTVAIATPQDVFRLDDLAASLGAEVEAVLSDPSSVSAAITQYYGATAAPAPAPQSAPAPAPAPQPAPTPEFVIPPLQEPAPAPIPQAPAPVVPPVPVQEPVATQPVEPELEVSAEDFFELSVAEAPHVVEAPAVDAVEIAAPTAVVEPRGIEQVVETPAMTGVEALNLDVLAVADEGKVAVLVADILEQAISRGATRIHLLPYKGDFFVVFRVKGRLERVGSAPLSMQAPLVDGFKAWAKLSSIPASVPALNRMRSDIGGKNLVLTVSVVPTVAGQRVVISIAANRSTPRTLAELGMGDAEEKALQAMVERGRGLLLVSAPVAGGRSSTYYALLAHAAAAGKTVYSVERSIDYEIPAVAQVLVNPGSSVSPASYFAAGMRQDTDVMAIDTMQSMEDIHLAIEAAGLGKLVIATFSGADIAGAVRRILDTGAEPVSLASALTLGVGQRLVRLNCAACSIEEKNPLADRIPGAAKGTVSKRGAGCANCGRTGFLGATGIFEVLPFTEPVRGVISRGAAEAEIVQAARSAGMRPMVASGLAKVREGLVSPEELNRVLRFAD